MDSDSYIDAGTDSDSYIDAGTDSDSYTDADADSDSYTDVGTDMDTEPHVDCIRYVDIDATGSAPDGRTWASAFTEIQEGIEAAFSAAQIEGACQVWVAEGIYYIYDTKNTDTLLLMPDVALYGGFEGSESRLDNRDWIDHITVLDGRDGLSGFRQVFHVVTGSDNSRLDGFFVTRRLANGFIPDNDGGGMTTTAPRR